MPSINLHLLFAAPKIALIVGGLLAASQAHAQIPQSAWGPAGPPLPPIQLQQLPTYPLSGSGNAGLAPLPAIPPVGTSSCSPVRVCNGNASYCVWQQVCR